MWIAPAGAVTPPELITATVESGGGGESAGFDGVVEAVRQTVVAAQVSGAVIALGVRVGDVVKAGQVLARIDARAAEQSAAASDADVLAARALLEAATAEFARQKLLFEKSFTSRAALERAEAQFKTTQAQVAAQIAQAGATRTQSTFYVVKAPYGGVVAEVPVALGDMALPGRALLTIYDPAALRVSAAVPQTDVGRMIAGQPIRIQFPGLPAAREWVTPARVNVLPTADPGTHTSQIRLDLPATSARLTPGTFARVWLPTQGGTSPRLYVPAKAIIRRAELTGLYVIDPNGKPVLRQVRLGRAVGDTMEILAGVSAGERVAVEPQAAARVR
ncbi:MAG: efflux RND transporter periplasmic adaptor subunit [Vicinamibacteria bacterium]|nr:efflux RND transporter periplasmic adaptor subunit [Vicinamibacteria bacterium]